MDYFWVKYVPYPTNVPTIFCHLQVSDLELILVRKFWSRPSLVHFVVIYFSLQKHDPSFVQRNQNNFSQLMSTNPSITSTTLL